MKRAAGEATYHSDGEAGRLFEGRGGKRSQRSRTQRLPGPICTEATPTVSDMGAQDDVAEQGTQEAARTGDGRVMDAGSWGCRTAMTYHGNPGVASMGWVEQLGGCA